MRRGAAAGTPPAPPSATAATPRVRAVHLAANYCFLTLPRKYETTAKRADGTIAQKLKTWIYGDFPKSVLAGGWSGAAVRSPRAGVRPTSLYRVAGVRVNEIEIEFQNRTGIEINLPSSSSTTPHYGQCSSRVSRAGAWRGECAAERDGARVQVVKEMPHDRMDTSKY
ncbi:hypothetical protein EVAR_90804_1 [Eumeta japonica]|uniref:Uncharacterized protein n=1 Tax=Eumeta variegata TaxID=151549 RepID=A0A4C2A871_EUMVA|nr:hypothetical protein EVAR_90804_1 [Eumeta japonica]